MSKLSPLAFLGCVVLVAGCGDEKPKSVNNKPGIEKAEREASAKYEKEMKKDEGKKDEGKKEETKKDEGKKDGK